MTHSTPSPICEECEALRALLQETREKAGLLAADRATYQQAVAERDEAIRRASDVTIECGRLEERLTRCAGWRDRLATENIDLGVQVRCVIAEARRWKQVFRSAWLGLVECRRERDEARAECEALRLELYSKPLEYNALAEQLDEARAALREMVDAAHTSFSATYPLAKELRVRFEWLTEKKLKETP